ncbi:MAG: V-type ATP synthase subunit E [Clostridia bacterium]|nr:V-type ATP synthase subunit E [Clostridia bacterium]
MTGLSKITDKILAEANNDAAKTRAAADAECRRIADEYKRKAEKIRRDIEERTEAEASAIVSRAKSSAAMEQRNAALSAQSALIDKAFENAKKEILYLPDDKYLDFLTSMLVTVLMRQSEDERISREVYGEEDAPTAECYEIILNERDLAKHGKALMENLRRRLVGKSNSDVIAKTKLSRETAKIDGGLILKYGNIEINSSISMLFEQSRPAMEARVSHILFDKQ